jgi:hypothetical protein
MTEEKTIMEFNIGDICKSNSPYFYRNKEIFKIIGVSYIWSSQSNEFRYIYIIQYPDKELGTLIVKPGGWEIEKVKK